MHIFEPLFQKYRDKTTLGLLIILSLTLLILPRQSKLNLAREALNGLLLPFNTFTHFVDDFVDIRRENRELKRVTASLLLERERLLQFREERERMRKLAAFKEEQFLKLVPCEVIGRNLDRYHTVLVIDKGSLDSLKVRMPVLSYQGYVGKLIEVFEHSAWIELICSRNNPVSCIDKRSRVVGTLEWIHHSFFELKYVGITEDIAVGDTLVTSGFGGVVPKGYPVGVVTKVARAIDGLSLRVEARSDIQFRSLEEVFVVVDEIPWEKAIFYSELDSLQLYGK
jgi:rod shape-determining protein MreC